MKSNLKKETSFKKSKKGIILFKDKIYIPNNEDLKKENLFEAHTTPYSLHLSKPKMYRDLKKHYWWLKIKKDIVKFVAQCFKVEHQSLVGF